MYRAFHYLTALIWAVIGCGLFVMHLLDGLDGALAGIPSALFGFDPSISDRAREQISGREFSWFAFGALIAFAIAVYCLALGSKKKPNQPSQPMPLARHD